jgi:holo-[acyl-carrier protein] synthase
VSVSVTVCIVGAGLDVTPVERVARLITDHADSLARIFTATERAHADRVRGRRRDVRYAECFAAKEAVMKAIGTGWRSDVAWPDIDTRVRDARGGVVLTGGALAEAQRRGIARMFVSAGSTRTDAVASAVAEGNLDA